jgi:SAM-dependent methyltransferase
MHAEAYEQMAATLAQIEGEGLRVLDVGSLDYNGTYRPLVEAHGWHYTGLDICNGQNVDVVADDPFVYPLPDAAYDIVMSGSTMEHVTAVWRWIPELARLVRPGGWLVIITHWQFKVHHHPVDCWRILPDGMRYLFDEAGNLSDYQIEIVNKTDIIGIARKR